MHYKYCLGNKSEEDREETWDRLECCHHDRGDDVYETDADVGVEKKSKTVLREQYSWTRDLCPG